jgi:hypothetical protein
LEKIKELKLNNVLKKKNPYLFKAKNVLTAQDLIKGILDAYLSSQEEALFGIFMEGLAIFVCNEVYGAQKSKLTGLDMEFVKDDIYYIVEIKAGWNWGNASQIKQLRKNFINAQALLSKKLNNEIVAINGCCFGKDKKPNKNGYFKLCGQGFWEFISGDENIYTEIIKPIGYKAKEKNQEFLEAYSAVINQFTMEFSQTFCEEGVVIWERLLKYNSGK